jgi:hypothetical protein
MRRIGPRPPCPTSINNIGSGLVLATLRFLAIVSPSSRGKRGTLPSFHHQPGPFHSSSPLSSPGWGLLFSRSHVVREAGDYLLGSRCQRIFHLSLFSPTPSKTSTLDSHHLLSSLYRTRRRHPGPFLQNLLHRAFNTSASVYFSHSCATSHPAVCTASPRRSH